MSLVNELVAGLRQNVYRCLEADPGLSVYVLLDLNHPVADDHPLHPQALAAREVPLATQTVQRRDFDQDPDLCPRLLTLRTPSTHDYPDEALVDLLVDCAHERCGSVNGSYVAAWLLSSSPAEAVAKHIEHASVMHDLAAAKRRVLPYFEPHRFALIDALPPGPRGAHVDRLLGPVAHWFYVDAIGELHCANRSDEPAAAPHGLPLAAWQAQARAGEARLVLMALAKARAVMPRQPEVHVDRAVADAHRLGLREMEDVMFFCLNCFTLAPDWFEHPVASAAIRRSIDAGARLTDTLQQLSDDELNAIGSRR